MKGKPNWVHFSFGGWVPLLKRNENGETTSCGKTARRIRATTDENNVTCPRCIEVLRAKMKTEFKMIRITKGIMLYTDLKGEKLETAVAELKEKFKKKMKGNNNG